LKALRFLELLHLIGRPQSNEYGLNVQHAHRRKQPPKEEGAVVALFAAPHSHRGACKCPVEVVDVAHHRSVSRDALHLSGSLAAAWAVQRNTVVPAAAK
jgi:hypothetical protein